MTKIECHMIIHYFYRGYVRSKNESTTIFTQDYGIRFCWSLLTHKPNRECLNCKHYLRPIYMHSSPVETHAYSHIHKKNPLSDMYVLFRSEAQNHILCISLSHGGEANTQMHHLQHERKEVQGEIFGPISSFI